MQMRQANERMRGSLRPIRVGGRDLHETGGGGSCGEASVLVILIFVYSDDVIGVKSAPNVFLISTNS